MTECPPNHHARSPWLKEDSVADFASRHVQLSARGKRVLDRLLMLLPSHLKSQPTPRVSQFQPALLFSICDALQLDHTISSAEQSDPSVLPSVLDKLRDWRLLDPDYRYSPGGIHKLACDLAGIIDEGSASTSLDLNRAPYAFLRVRWVGSNLQRESQHRESFPLTLSSPSPSRSCVLDSAQRPAHALPDLNEGHSDAGYQSCQVGRVGTPDPEDTSITVSPRYRSISGFRSGCSACRHLRLSPPTSTPASPRMASIPFTDIKQFDVRINPSITSPRHPKFCVQHTSPRKARQKKHKYSQSISRGAHVDENEPPTSKPVVVQQGIGISFPRQRTHSPRISNVPLPRDPFSPVATPVQRRLEPGHLLNQVQKGDKRTTSHRTASVDLRLSIANPCPNHSSPNDLHPLAPMRAQSFSCTPVKSHRVGSVDAGVSKLSSNAAGSRSSKRLPSWSRTHPTSATTSVEPIGSMSPPAAAKASPANPQPHPFSTWSQPSSTSIPRSLPSDMKHRDRRSASSQTHKHTLSVGVLPLSPASPLMHVRKWQV